MPRPCEPVKTEDVVAYLLSRVTISNLRKLHLLAFLAEWHRTPIDLLRRSVTRLAYCGSPLTGARFTIAPNEIWSHDVFEAVERVGDVEEDAATGKTLWRARRPPQPLPTMVIRALDRALFAYADRTTHELWVRALRVLWMREDEVEDWAFTFVEDYLRARRIRVRVVDLAEP